MGAKRKREKERNDPVKTLKPTEPISGPGRGGRVGASATQHLLRGVIKDNSREEDVRPSTTLTSSPCSPPKSTDDVPSLALCSQPREALLKYANVAETNPVWAGAWANQPKVFREYDQETAARETGGVDVAALAKKKFEERHKDK